MRKTFLSRKASSRKQRGVAIVFSLGILGLLTVLALGFASTALLNNSVSQNVMNDAYARTLARNLALTQAVYLINDKAGEADRGFVDYRKIYTYGTESYSTVKDFLLKMDCKLSGKGSDGTDQSVYLYYYTPANTDTDPSANVRWQYVKDSAQQKILGRYAYVVVPEKGGLCPTVNTAALAPTAANLTVDNIKSLESYVTLGTSTLGDLADSSLRWMSFGELIAKCQWSKAYSYNNMFKFYGYAPTLTARSPEAYWEDGKLYARFNLNRTDWDTDENPMTPEKLCGEGIALKEFKNDAGEPQQQECIPWLKKMYDNESTRDQALQIAANIIQYNLPATADAISNSDDWLSDDEAKKVKYIGIGKHPMLNELGFLVHVKASVEAALVSEDPENSKATYRYTPKYYVTVDTGAELLYPFGAASTITKTSEVTLAGLIKVGLSKFKDETELKNNLDTWLLDGALDSHALEGKSTLKLDLSATAAPTTTEEGDAVTTFTGTGYGWTGFKLSYAAKTTGWNSDPVYTKSSLFWKQQQGTKKKQCLVVELPSFQLETATSLGAHGDISIPLAKGMRVESINIDPEKVLLKYDGKNRDFVQKLAGYEMTTATDFKPADPANPAEEHVWFVAYEATDPLVNLTEDDWKKRTMETMPAVWDEATSLSTDSQYPGSLYDGTTEKHLNKTLTEDGFASSHAGSLLKLYGNITDSEPEPEPAYTASPVRRLPTGIMRNGQMLSFWELGCISRGKPFETLNLLKKNGATTPDYSYAGGDAVLFDQLKLSDNDYTEGKINLNAERHKVLEQVFSVYKNTSNNYGFLKQHTTTSKISALAYRKEIHKSTAANLLAAGSADRSFVKATLQDAPTSKNDNYPVKLATPHEDCLVCSLLKVTEHYCIQNRADLLLDHADLSTAGGTVPVEDDWNAFQDLLQYGDTYLEKIQIASKVMPILRAEPADVIYVVILAQSIKDIGGNTVVVHDWNGTGPETAVPSSNSTSKYRAYYMAGFRRGINSTTISGLTEPPVSGSEDGTPRLLKIYTKNELGKYDFGSDKITGQARLLATLVRNPETGKWKLVRVQNVD